MTRLFRIPPEGRIAGVCAGIAHYFDTDVTLVRLTWVILSIVPGALVGGVLAYVGAWLLIPADSTPQAATQRQRLTKSMSERRIAGVCGGIAEHFGLDPTVVRIAVVVLTIYPGAIVFGVMAYILGWFIIPAPAFRQSAESPA
jgi:phage shock protein C